MNGLSDWDTQIANILYVHGLWAYVFLVEEVDTNKLLQLLQLSKLQILNDFMGLWFLKAIWCYVAVEEAISEGLCGKL